MVWEPYGMGHQGMCFAYTNTGTYLHLHVPVSFVERMPRKLVKLSTARWSREGGTLAAWNPSVKHF